MHNFKFTISIVQWRKQWKRIHLILKIMGHNENGAKRKVYNPKKKKPHIEV